MCFIPAPLRDLLMWVGLSGLFRARWTQEIHDEWKRNLSYIQAFNVKNYDALI